MTHHPDHEVELFRESDCYRVFVDLPGFERDEIRVRWFDHHLTITAEHSDDPELDCQFHHSMGVPRHVREDSITATYRDGVLDVELPFAGETGTPDPSVAVHE